MYDVQSGCPKQKFRLTQKREGTMKRKLHQLLVSVLAVAMYVMTQSPGIGAECAGVPSQTALWEALNPHFRFDSGIPTL